MNRHERRKAEKESKQNGVADGMTAEAVALNEEYRRAQELQQKGELGAALNIYNRLLEIAPGQPDLCALTGSLHAQIGDLEGAKHYYQMSISSKADQPHVHTELALIANDLGEFEASLRSFDEALSHETDKSARAIIHDKKGRVLLANDRFEDALEEFKTAISAPKPVTASFLQIAYCYSGLNNKDAMKEWFLRSLDVNPGDIAATNSLVALYMLEGNLDDALTVSLRALTFLPEAAGVHVMLSDVHKARGEIIEARNALEAALSISPDDPEVLKRISDLGGTVSN